MAKQRPHPVAERRRGGGGDKGGGGGGDKGGGGGGDKAGGKGDLAGSPLAKLDTDKSGTLEASELAAADTNGDKSLSVSELEDAGLTSEEAQQAEAELGGGENSIGNAGLGIEFSISWPSLALTRPKRPPELPRSDAALLQGRHTSEVGLAFFRALQKSAPVFGGLSLGESPVWMACCCGAEGARLSLPTIHATPLERGTRADASLLACGAERHGSRHHPACHIRRRAGRDCGLRKLLRDRRPGVAGGRGNASAGSLRPDGAVAGHGLCGVLLSLTTRMPVSIAWSTPGAALLASSVALPGGFASAVGGFLVCAALLLLAASWRPLERLVTAIPPAIASAMLAGVFMGLCLAPARAIQVSPLWTAIVAAIWFGVLLVRRIYAVPAAVLAAGAIIVWTMPPVRLPA